MGMNQTPSGERVHIGFFGRRNAGKSSLVNAVTGQELAIVSEVRGTTTDPVYKAMELLPLGPVVIIDTPGIDDEGELGQKRVGKSRQVLNKTDIALLVVDGRDGKG
ncbi:MAG: 50S ribosome-binding GTPase, partial [Clostridium sp.]|nr:50S ribosome-binding GTPase [Clostridium sp.]